MVNRHPVTEPFWHPLEGSGMKLFLFMHLLRIATTLGDQIWGVMLTSTFGRGPCTYLGFLKGFLWEYPTKNQHQAALLWLVQRWYLQEMKTDGIEIDIGIMNGVMSACHLLSFFWSLFLNGWKSVVVSIERIEIFDFFSMLTTWCDRSRRNSTFNSGQEAHQWGHLQLGAPILGILGNAIRNNGRLGGCGFQGSEISASWSNCLMSRGLTPRKTRVWCQVTGGNRGCPTCALLTA